MSKWAKGERDIKGGKQRLAHLIATWRRQRREPSARIPSGGSRAETRMGTSDERVGRVDSGHVPGRDGPGYPFGRMGIGIGY